MLVVWYYGIPAVGGFLSVDICGIVKWVPECVAGDVWLLSVTMSLSVPNLIVRSALRQLLREERLMDDAEIGLMLAGHHPCR